MVFAQMRAAVQAAAPDKLATVMSAIAQAYGAGGLSDAEYETLDGLLAARRRVAQAVPTRARTLAAACAQVVPAVAPPPAGEGTPPNRAGTSMKVCATVAQTTPARSHHRTGSRPRTAESTTRRRRWAAAGYLPPRLAAAFTLGEQAVLAVVGKEIATRGRCTLALGHIAALAGVCTTTAKRAMRQAALVGLVDIEVRRVSGFRNNTNRVTIRSREWASWLRLRLPRSARADLGRGGNFAHGTDIGATSTGSQSRGAPGRWRPAGADRPCRPAARGAGA